MPGRTPMNASISTGLRRRSLRAVGLAAVGAGDDRLDLRPRQRAALGRAARRGRAGPDAAGEPARRKRATSSVRTTSVACAPVSARRRDSSSAIPSSRSSASATPGGLSSRSRARRVASRIRRERVAARSAIAPRASPLGCSTPSPTQTLDLAPPAPGRPGTARPASARCLLRRRCRASTLEIDSIHRSVTPCRCARGSKPGTPSPALS